MFEDYPFAWQGRRCCDRFSDCYRCDVHNRKPYKDVCIYEAKKYKNTYNLFVNRFKPYNPNGRNQTEEEAKEIDRKIKAFLTDNNLEFKEINGTEEGYNAIVKDIIERLGK